MEISRSVILSEERLKNATDFFLKQDAFVFDFEAMGDNRGVCHLNRLNWVSLATHGTTIVVPFGHPRGECIGWHREARQYGGSGPKAGTSYRKKIFDYAPPPEQLDIETVFSITEPLWMSESITKIGHGEVYDLGSAQKYLPRPIPQPYFDTVTGTWLCNENMHTYKLKKLTEKIYGFKYDDEEVGKCIEEYPFNKVAYYSYCDAKYPWLLYKDLLPLIQEWGIESVLSMEMDILEVLVQMRLHGSYVDIPRLQELAVDLRDRRTVAEDLVYEAAGRKFNMNSPKQLQKIMYLPKSEEGQGLKGVRMTDTGKDKVKNGETPDYTFYSTDKESLEEYPNNLFVQRLVEYRDVNKLLSTYVLSYLGDSDAGRPCQIYNQRIHADFVQFGTTTGRFSCREPNLQNIPRPDTDLGKLIRGAWVAPPGYKLVVADYGQIELVMFAHYCGQGALFEGFWEGIDPHTMTAAAILGKDPYEVVAGERQRYGKTMNFSMAFGAGPEKVARMLDVSVAEAKRTLKAHQAAMPEVYSLKRSIISKCKSRKPVPYVRTLSRRVRRLPDIILPRTDELKGRVGYAERQAVSAVIQGSAADLIKWAMVRTDKALKEQCPGAYLTLTVHDEIVLEAPEKDASLAASILEEAMIGQWMQDMICVPLKADVKIVERWSDAK